MSKSMEPQDIIARRIARELKSGMLVNLGIGIPTLVANHVPNSMHGFFQSENGMIGIGAPPSKGMAHPTLTDAVRPSSHGLPGACAFDSAMSFGLIRGGHLDLTVLRGLQVDQCGHLANWVIPNKMVLGMGGAMDLASGAKRVVVAMQHTAKGVSKVVKKCTLPITSLRQVDLVVTELAAIEFSNGRATLLETGPGVSIAQVAAATEARDPGTDSRNAFASRVSTTGVLDVSNRPNQAARGQERPRRRHRQRSVHRPGAAPKRSVRSDLNWR
jgi:acetate CoA/acetoacetate CoA-transferase beta subunit